MSKHGEGFPNNSEQEHEAVGDDGHNGNTTLTDRYKNDKILQWIEKRRTQLANAGDNPSTENGLKILDELQESREKAIDTLLSKHNEALRNRCDEALKDSINRAYDILQADIKYVQDKAGRDPSLTPSEAERRIADRKKIYQEQVHAMKQLNNWEKFNKYGDDGVNKEGGKARFGEETSQAREGLTTDSDSFATISQFVPRMEWQAAAERTDLVEKVYERFPKRLGESNEKYKERLITLDAGGDIDEAIADILVDPNSRIGRELKRRLAKLEELGKSLIEQDAEVQKGVATLGWVKKIVIRRSIAEQKRQEVESEENKKHEKTNQHDNPSAQEKESATERWTYRRSKVPIWEKMGRLARRVTETIFPESDQEDDWEDDWE